MWGVSESGATEMYMMPGAGSNPNVASTPPLGGVEYTGNELSMEYIFDQGINYQVPSNYGYYCAVVEPPGGWSGNNNALGIDGQDHPYLGMQAENLPYVYYAPSYGYSQSPYNQYMPYFSAATMGIDGSYIGAQQYMNNSSFPSPISSPAYIPVFFHPGSDFVPSSAVDPLIFGSGASVAIRPASDGIKFKAPQSSINESASSRVTDQPIPSQMSQPSRHILEISKLSDASHANVQSNLHFSSEETVIHGSNTIPIQSSVKAATSSTSRSINSGPNTHGWDAASKNVQGANEITSNQNKGQGILGELNLGSRSSKSQSQQASESVDVAEATKKTVSGVQENIVIDADHYNKEEFAIDYTNAKFFVIKSYSEDDVHKSIKYNVWSSTPNGNKRLDSAFEDAKRLSIGNSKSCPVFLFFSVNASGQFCGVAEMLGPVDFSKDMDFWQQDKWSGSFPVKWHMIKDVPNSSLRHIILENNENKPVTNSRDTQEIPYNAGMIVLKIFKYSPLRTSILDDFPFYEERQKKMLEDKFRHLGSFGSTTYVPGVIIKNKLDIKIDKPRKQNEHQLDNANAVGHHPCDSLHQSSKSNEDQQIACRTCQVDVKHSNYAVSQPVKAEIEQSHMTDGSKVDVDCESGSSDRPQETGGKQSSFKSINTLKANVKMSKPFVDQLAKSDGEQLSPTKQHIKADVRSTNATRDQPSQPDEKQLEGESNQFSQSNGNFIKPKDINIAFRSAPGGDQAKDKIDALHASAEKSSIKATSLKESKPTDPVIKDELLSGDPPIGKLEDSGTPVVEVPTDVVKIGSMEIKVQGLGESSANVPDVGTVAFESKRAKLAKNGMLAGGTQQKK